MLKMSEIVKLESNMIGNKVGELRKELFSFRMQKVTSGVEKPHKIRTAKKNIARMLTELNNRKNKKQ